MPCLPQQKLPDIKCQYVTMNVSAVLDVNHFWAQYVDRETNLQMKQINEILSRSLTPLAHHQIEVELIYAAPFVVVSPRTVAPGNND